MQPQKGQNAQAYVFFSFITVMYWCLQLVKVTKRLAEPNCNCTFHTQNERFHNENVQCGVSLESKQ